MQTVMNDLKHRIERGFEAFARIIYRKKWLSLVLILIFAGGLISQLPKMKADMTTVGLFGEKDPVLVQYQSFQDQFGQDDIVLLGIQPNQIFDQSFLLKLKALHEELEEKVPHLDEVTSLINVTATRGDRGEFIVEELLKNWPETEEELEVIKQRVLSKPLYKNAILSESGLMTAMVVRSNTYSSKEGENEEEEFGGNDDNLELDDSDSEANKLSAKDKAAFTNVIKEVVSRYESQDFKVFLAGTMLVSHELATITKKEVPIFIMLVNLAMIFCLIYLFRRIFGVLLPLIVVNLALLSTLGLMAAFGIPMTLVTQILPGFIIAVGIGDAVHLLTIFYKRYQKNSDKEAAIVHAMGHSGLAMLMTSLTTAAGLLSFASAPMPPVANLGIFGAVGVMLALLYSLVLIPAVVAIVPIRPKKVKESKTSSGVDRFLSRMGGLGINHPWKVVGVCLALGLIGFMGASQLKFSHDTLKFFPESSIVRQDTEAIDHQLKGSATIEVIVDTQSKNGLYEPEIMNKLEEVGHYASQLQDGELFVGKTTSVVDTLKDIHQALNENNPDYNRVPQDRVLIAQELLLFENGGADDLENLVDTDFSKARVTLRLPRVDAQAYTGIITKLDKRLQEIFEGKAQVIITGLIPMVMTTVDNLITTMANSYVIAGAVISLMMILMIGNLRIGVVSMIPNFLPILMGLGLMGFMEIPLNLSTIIVGSIAIGLVVDDTIHFMHNFLRYYHETNDAAEAVQHTLQTSGRAMLFTTVILTSNYLTFLFATMSFLVNFGIILAFIITFALLVDLLLSPALMVLITRTKIKV